MSDHQKYWGGSTTSNATIRPLAAENFKEFLEKYINIPVPIQLSREDFRSRPERERNAIKAGPYVTAVSFKLGTSHRCDDNAESLELICFDLDGGIEAKQFAESPETLIEHLWPFNFAVYHTSNSTPENPRLRIIVDVKSCDLAHHKRIVRYLMMRLGLPKDFKGYRETTVLSQPAYRPVSFLGEDSHSPVIASRTEGYPLDVVDLPEMSEDEVEEAERTYAWRGESSEETSLQYLPLMGITVEDIEPVLRSIPPDITYGPWTRVISSLIHQFRDTDSARAAFELFDDWSSGSDKYKENEPYAKWKSFTPEPKGKAPVTIRTLFMMAQEHGWVPTKLATKVKQGVLEWIAECEDGNVLQEEGATRIAELPFKNDMVEEALVIALRDRIKTLSGTRIDKATIKRQVNNVRRKTKEEESSGELEGWLRPIYFITSQNVFRNAMNGVEYSPAGFDNTFSEFLMPKDGESEQARSGKPAVLPVNHALNVRKIPKVDGVTYDPRFGAADPVFNFEGRSYLNEYRLSSVPTMDAVNSKMAGKWIRKLLKSLIGNAEHERLILDFISFIVQFPGIKIRWAPIIQSCQGAGKGTLGDILSAAIGVTNVNIIAPGAMSSDFNSWRAGCQVVIFDELLSPGQNRAEVANKIKDAITNDRVSLNQKFKDPRVVINLVNFVAFTNFKNSIHIEESDRRFFVIYSPLQFKHQITPLGYLFDACHNMVANFPGAIRHYLMNHEISEDFPVNGPAPDTKYRRQMVETSKNHLLIKSEQLIADPDFLMIGEDVISMAHLNALTEHEARNNAKVEIYLSSLGYVAYEEGKMFNIDGMRTQIWVHLENYIEGILGADEILLSRIQKDL